MNKPKNPNSLLAEQIEKRLVSENLIRAEKDFVTKLAEGKLKDTDWRTLLLDKIHRKDKSS